MSLELLRLAEKEGIIVGYWSFKPPVKAIYVPGDPPIIGLDKHLNRAEFRSYLAEEIGHHLTSFGTGIIQPYFCSYQRTLINIMEYRARAWAARRLISEAKLLQALKYSRDIWDLAEELEVTPQLAQMRLNIWQRKTAVNGSL